MKKLSLAMSLSLLLPVSVAFAQVPVQVDTDVRINTTARVQSDDTDVEADTEESSNGMMRVKEADDYAAGTMMKEEREASTTDSEDAEHGMGEAHRSAVATFVQSLLRDAERDGGIGDEVRAVAKSQDESASTTAEAITKVETRSALKTFLIGTDWKNIGVLRSQVAKSGSDIARLETAIGSVTDASVRANLQTQIDAMKAEQVKIQAFVEAKANVFSLFGWFTKLFAETGSEN